MRYLTDFLKNQTINYNTAASGANSIITLSAVTNEFNIIDKVVLSYDDSITTGTLRIVDTTNSTTLLNTNITNAGTHQFDFKGGLAAPKSAAVEIRAIDGNALKKLSVYSR